MANLVLPQGAEVIGQISTPTLERVYGPEGARAQREVTARGRGYLAEGLPFSEEFAAGVGAVSDWLFGGSRASISDVPSLYRERLALENQGTDAFRAENPVTSVIANVGAAASAAPKAAAQGATTLGGRAVNTLFGTAPAAATIGGRIGQGVAAGAAGGALAGFDEQRGGGIVPDLEQVGTAALIGGGIGGGIAVLAPLVEGVAAGIRNITGLQGAGAERRAQQMVMEALEADGVPIDRIAELERRGKPLTLADVEALTGRPATNTRSLFGNAARMGGDEGRRFSSFLDERSVGIRDATGAPAGGAADRMSDDVARAFRLSGETARQADARLIQQRADDARPLYGALRGRLVDVDDELAAVLARPSVKRALGSARRTFEDMGGRMPRSEGFDDIADTLDISAPARAEIDPSALDGMLDEIRTRREVGDFFRRYDEVGGEIATLRRRPLSREIINMGGIDPGSAVARELRVGGVTPQTFPGLFRRGGLRDLDNIVADQSPGFVRQNVATEGNYLSRQGMIDALISEAKSGVRGAGDNALISEMNELERMLPEYEALRASLGTGSGAPFPGDLASAERLPFDVLDQLKKVLDARINWGKTPQGGAAVGDVAALKRARQDLLEVLDARFPDYAAARAASAGPAADLEALRAGQKFARADADEVAETIADLLPDQADLFRLGAAQELLRKIRGTVDGGDASKIFQNPNMRDRLREVFPDEGTFNRFMRAASDERIMQQTRGELIKGSQTATRQAADQSAIGDALGSAALDVVGGGGAVTASTGARLGAGLLRRGGERIMQGTNEAVFGEIARMGQRTDPGAVVGAARGAQGGRLPATLGTVRGTVQAPGAIAAAASTEPAAIRAAAFGGAVDRAPEQPLPAPQRATTRLMLPQGAEVIEGTTREQMRASPRANIADLDPDIKSKWSDVQSRFDTPLTVISAHRTPNYNQAVGGARRSQHLKGKAIDVDVSGLSEAERLDLIRKASAAGFTGVGIYEDSLHFDTGPRRAWGPSYKKDSVPAWARREIRRHVNKGNN